MTEHTYPEYVQLRKGEGPPADPHEVGVRLYADTSGALRTIQSDGTDAAVGGGSLPAGGTTGQVLTKASNADGDADWEEDGGAAAFVGAVLVMSASQSGYASNGVIAFDTAAFDSDGFFNAPGTKLVVSAGFAGWYRVGLVLNVTDFDLVAQTDQSPKVFTSGAPDNLIGLYVTDQTIGGGAVCVGVMGPLAEGDDLTARLQWNGGGTGRILATGSQFTCEYLGPDAT